MIIPETPIDYRGGSSSSPVNVEETKVNLTKRYVVLKDTDIFNSLSFDELSQFFKICEKVNAHRQQRGASEFNGLVIEEDWPEFDPTVELLSKRISKGN